MAKEFHSIQPHNPFAAGRPPINPDDRKMYAGRIRRKFRSMIRDATRDGGFKSETQFLESLISYVVKNNLIHDVRKNSVDE